MSGVVSVGKEMIGILARDGMWKSPDDDSGLVAKDELYQHDPYEEIERVESDLARTESERNRTLAKLDEVWKVNGELRSDLVEARKSIARLKQIVSEQANDEALWFVAHYATEAYAQQELRKLHAAIEGIDSENPMPTPAEKDLARETIS